MDLIASPSDSASAPQSRKPAGPRNGEIPDTSVEVMFRRAMDEEVLWRGKPEPLRHAAAAFHTNSIAIYFVILTGFAFAKSGSASAMTVAIMGLAGYLILTGMGVYSAHKSAYVLTNHRLMILTGLAVEKRISIPLKRVAAANLRERSKGYGDILLELNGGHDLSYMLLWPHARSFRIWKPQPLMRAVPDARTIATKLAEACAQYAPIERNLTNVKDADPTSASEELGGATA